MSDQPADNQLPADSAPTSSDVPFKNRDFRASARQRTDTASSGEDDSARNRLRRRARGRIAGSQSAAPSTPEVSTAPEVTAAPPVAPPSPVVEPTAPAAPVVAETVADADVEEFIQPTTRMVPPTVIDDVPVVRPTAVEGTPSPAEAAAVVESAPVEAEAPPRPAPPVQLSGELAAVSVVSQRQPVVADVSAQVPAEEGVTPTASVTQPTAVEPTPVEPVAAAPVVSEPAVVVPAAVESVPAEPVAPEAAAVPSSPVEPVAAVPVVSEPAPVVPVAAESVPAEPVAPEAAVVPSAPVEPIAAAPVAVEPEVVAPSAVESVPAEPAAPEAAAVSSAPVEPVAAAPVVSEPEVVVPVVAESVPAEPVASKVAAVVPAPVVPTPVVPVAAEAEVVSVAPVESAPAAPVAESIQSEPAVEEVSPATDVVTGETSETPAADEPENGFAALGLHDDVLQAVLDSGYSQPTEIQAEIIPYVLDGRDVLAQSQTGSGKTAAFALPILSQITTGYKAPRKPQVLVLAPTRELAVQVSDSFAKYGAALPGLTVASIYGGQSYENQFRLLKRGVQVVVGTPGRIIDHINRGTLDLSQLRSLVLDEADEMLNMGFLDDVLFVLEHTPEERQVALFSATLPGPIRTIAEEHLHDPARVTIKRKTMTADSIRQRALFVPVRDKLDVLTRVLEAEETDGVIIFTKTKDATVTVAEHLAAQGLASVALNGDMPQKLRERAIDQLKKGRLDIIVATDVAARGLDVPRISHVINYDIPSDNESYIHRVGRTGRAGRKGEAILLLKKSQRHRLKQIERSTRQTIEIIQPPTADDINAARSRRLVQQIAETIEQQDLSVFEQLISDYAEESGTSLTSVAAALAHLGQQGRPFLVEELPQRGRDRFERDRDNRGRDRDQRDFRSRRDDDGERGAYGRDRGGRREEFADTPVEEGMQRYRIAVGHRDGVKPGNIVGAIANEGGIDGNAIGAIRIHATWSTIDLPEGMPADVQDALQDTVVAGRALQLRLYTSEPQRSGQRRGRYGDRPGGRRQGGQGGGGGRRFGGQGGANRSGGGAGGKFGKRKFGRKPGRSKGPGRYRDE